MGYHGYQVIFALEYITYTDRLLLVLMPDALSQNTVVCSLHFRQQINPKSAEEPLILTLQGTLNLKENLKSRWGTLNLHGNPKSFGKHKSVGELNPDLQRNFKVVEEP